MKYARKRDVNERTIIMALRRVGASVQQLDGSGVPDLLVAFRSKLFLIEVKNPNAKGGGKYNTGDGNLTAAQTKWLTNWQEPLPVVVTASEEALCAIGVHERIAPDPSCQVCGAEPGGSRVGRFG